MTFLLLLSFCLSWIGMGKKALAIDCASCSPVLAAQAAQNKSLAQYKALLQKNEAYLATLQPYDTSKNIKVRSNIAIIGIRIETLQNHLIESNQRIQTLQCEKCPHP